MRAAALAVAFAVLACEPPPDVEPPPCRNPEPGVIEVGAGDLFVGFRPLADDDEVRIELGPQGLHMVVVSARVFDLEPASAGRPTHRVFVALRDDDRLIGGTVTDVEPLDGSRGSVDFLGLRAILTVDDVNPLVGRNAELTLTVLDGCGRELTATRTLRIGI